MKIKSQACCIAFFFLVPLGVGSRELRTSKIEGVLLDISDSRIVNATVTFESEKRKYRTKTREDGTYTIELEPSTYTMRVDSNGFCTLRRSGFVLPKHTTVQFNFQMWVCPTDTEFVRFVEFPSVPRTHLKPLLVYGESDLVGEKWRVRGPNASDDGTGHQRQYPAIFIFNLLTVEGKEIQYDSRNQILNASGNVRWQDGDDSGAGENVQIKLNGLRPIILRATHAQQNHR